MEHEAIKPLWKRVGGFLKDYGQTLFTVGTLIFAVGGANATLQNIKEKTDTLDAQRVEQAQLATQVKELAKSQDKQAEATNKLGEAVYTLSQSVSRIEGRQEVEQNKKRK